ncbi:MAG: hypothetical protein EA420_16530 [Candidatus Competibacteraceae bacterium]|nr:MAG: hypothetical protein EA420_16530 [Candidatus Competibacteraceae bacterium]
MIETKSDLPSPEGESTHRPPAFLDCYGPERGYAVEIEFGDLLSLKPGLLRLYEAAVRAGRKPEDLGLPPLAPAAGLLVCRATLMDATGHVWAAATAVQTQPDDGGLEGLETAARQRLRAALGVDAAAVAAAAGLAGAPPAVPAALDPPRPAAPPADDATLDLLRRQLAHQARLRGVAPPVVATREAARDALKALLQPEA